MKIIQITDLHIAEEGESTHGVAVRENFHSILSTVSSLSPDLVVLTGDLCLDTGNEMTYQWIRSQLDFLAIPYLVIGGNHDHAPLLTKAFNVDHLMVGDELFYKREFGQYTALFLETSSGEMSHNQLDWLNLELQKPHDNIIIFMHHPPVIGGVPFMDNKYALRNMEEVQSILFNFPHHLNIFCGHYHVEKTLNTRNITVHITPSTYFQIDSHATGFKVDHYRIACREINLRDDGVVESSVIYQKGNTL